MQPTEEDPSARCRSSTDASLPFPVESKGVDIRRFRHGLDPRYSVYRWDCGSYPYFKAPVPTSAASYPVAQPAFAPNNIGYPGHVSTAPDLFCDGRGECYGGVVVGSSGQDFMPQPQRCICPDTHDPRYHPQHLGSDAMNWEPRSAGGCLCCGQHVSNPHGPRRSNHQPPPRHLDSSGRLFQPVFRAVVAGPDVVHVYPPSARKSIDATCSRLQEGSVAPGAQCLPSSSSAETSLCIGSGLVNQRSELRRDGCAGLQLMEEKISSTSTIVPYTDAVVSTDTRDGRRSNDGRERETMGASKLNERFGSITTEDREDNTIAITCAMKNIGSATNEEPKRSDLTTGKISDAKITPTRSSSKVTPLYGLPSWWGDEPVPDFDQKRKYSYPTVTPSSSSSSSDSPTQKKQTEHSDRVSIATARTSLSNSNPSDATTKGGSLGPTGVPTTDYNQQTSIIDRVDVHGVKHSLSNKDLVHCPIIFETPGSQKSGSRSLRNSESHGCLGTSFEMSTFSDCSPENNNFESPICNTSSQHRSLQICGHHSPPERDRPPSTVDGEVPPPPPLQRFLYPDPLLPLPVERDFRLVTCGGDDCGGPLKCKAPTAFIVDLQEMDDDNDNDNGNDNEDNSQRRSITVKTSLRQFLPRRCERSLQRRLSWMKQNRKPHSATERGEGRTEKETSGVDMVATTTTDPRQRFRLSLQRSSSFKDSFEEAVASDAIADDVSEAGTYTIDVSSDGESVAVADARERILATFGITGIEDEELEKGEWTESGNGYFEKDLDGDSSNKDLSLKSRTIWKPTTLNCDNAVKNDSRSNATEPVTPTAESYTWSFSEAFSPPPPPSKNDLPAQDDIVLTIYTETAAGCSITRSVDQPESHRMILHQDVMCPPQRLRCLDTSVLLTETDRSTLDAGHLLLEPDTLASSCYTRTMPRHSDDEACFSLGSNKAGRPYMLSTSTGASEHGRIILPTDRDYFKIPASTYSGAVSSLQIGVVPAAGILSDAEMLDPGLALRRKSSGAVSGSGDSLESPGRVGTAASGNALSANVQSSKSGASSSNQGLQCDPEKHKDGTIRTGSNGSPANNTVGNNSCGNSIDYKSDSDEDGSPVDPVVDKVPARAVTSGAAEVTLKPPAEESVQVIVSQKSRTTRKSVEENQQTTKIVESESPAKQAETRDKKPRTSNIGGGPKTQLTSPITDKPSASRHPKTKPPTPKSFPKSPSFPDGQLASRRCFSDLDVAGHDETSSEATASPMTSEGKGIGGKGATASSVEHTRMNRTFALRCARREASDGTESNRSDNQQRSARTVKKTTTSSSSKFDDAQRSRSASRSRPGGASPRSLFESSRSADNSLNLGQRTVKKSQEIDRKTRQTTDTMSRSLTRDDDSSSQKSAAATTAFRPPNAIKTTAKKKNLASDKGKEDMSSSEGAFGATVKGSPVQSRPLSSSMTVPEAAAAGNEWTRRKKYNPRQSMQTEVSVKKTGGKTDGKAVAGNVDKTESKSRNRKKVADAGGKNTPSTPSDWTDDEKLQLTPRGRDLPAVCQLSAKVKLLSDQVLQTLRKRPEFKVNEMVLQSPKQASSDTDSLENTSPEFLYIFHNLEAAERQMSAVFKVLSSHN